MISRFITSLFLLTILVHSTAQNLPERVLNLPLKFAESPTMDIDYSPATETRATNWVVYSDRKDNQTFSDASASNPFKKLDFLGLYYVVEEQGEYIRIAQDDNITFGGDLSPRAVDFGWIKKEYMLLWQRCYVTDRKIDKKAMLLNTVATLQNAPVNVEQSDKIVKFYANPEMTVESDQQSSLFQVFYIYKFTETSVLLGRSNRISEQVQNQIMGWAPIDRIAFWDHSVAIEPNWEDEACEERKTAGYPAKVFRDQPAAKKYANGDMVGGEFWGADPFQKRHIGDWRRFPVLKRKGKLLRTGIMGEISSVKGKTMKAEDNAQIQRQYNDTRKSKRTINLIFVIDGTSSMQPYFGSVSKALTRSMDRMAQKYQANNMQFGSVVYRDKAEGNRLTDVRPLTNDYKEIALFLNDVEAKDYFDQDAPEAVYYGLKTALRQTGIKKGETNVIVLIGDAGNHHRMDESTVELNDLTYLLEENDCHMLTLQVANKNAQTYNEFISQSKFIIQQIATSRYNQNRSLARGKVALARPVFSNIDEYTHKLENGALIGRVIAAPVGVSISGEKIGNEIENIVYLANEYTNTFINTIDNIMMDGRDIKTAVEKANTFKSDETSTVPTQKYVSSYTPAVLDYLRKLNIPDMRLNLVLEQKFQFYMTGWTTLDVDGLAHPLFKSVLFLTRFELGEILNDFDDLLIVTSAADQRKAMKDAWVGLLQKHIGNIDIAEIEDKTMEDITQMVFGLPSTSDLLKSVKLKHITDPAAFDDRNFQNLVTQIQRKQRQLDRIFNQDNYEYSFSSNDVMYYWIEEDLLP